MQGGPRKRDSSGPVKSRVGLECCRQRVHEPIDTDRVESVLAPQPKDAQGARLPVDPRLDSSDEPIARQDRQNVVAPASTGAGT